VKKIAVLTSHFGSNADSFPSVVNQYDDVDYYAFVDRDYEGADGWRLINSTSFSLDEEFANRRNAKIYKVAPSLFLPEYDYYVWHDAINCLNVHPKEIIEEYMGESDMAIFAHPHRNCIYQEAQVLAYYNLDHIDLLKNQINAYSAAGYPKNYGLYELPCFVLKNNATTRKMSLMWWEQICQFSSRDQISFPFVLGQMKEELNISILPGYVHHSDGNKLFLFLDKHGKPTDFDNRDINLFKRQIQNV